MAEMPKIDKKYLKLSDLLKDLDVGESGYYPPDAVRVDVKRQCWVNQLAKQLKGVDPDSSSEPHEWVYITRGNDGVKVAFPKDHKHPKWETGLKPTAEESEGYEWLPVLDFGQTPKR